MYTINPGINIGYTMALVVPKLPKNPMTAKNPPIMEVIRAIASLFDKLRVYCFISIAHNMWPEIGTVSTETNINPKFINLISEADFCVVNC